MHTNVLSLNKDNWGDVLIDKDEISSNKSQNAKFIQCVSCEYTWYVPLSKKRKKVVLGIFEK